MFFSKYSASGNDFIITHSFNHERDFFLKLTPKICHRQLGIGADGLIVLKPSKDSSLDFEWEFYNSDGSIPKMCGNGSRAAAKYAKDSKLARDIQKFQTLAGVICANIEGEWVESELTHVEILQKNIQEKNALWWLIDTGVPHLVCIDDVNLNKEDLRELRHKYNANVNLAKLENNRVIARTFERGVEDETLACGTGMAAMFYYLLLERNIANPMLFNPASKEDLYLREKNGKLFLKGKVTKICDFAYPL